jgi:hypothetical protein
MAMKQSLLSVGGVGDSALPPSPSLLPPTGAAGAAAAAATVDEDDDDDTSGHDSSSPHKMLGEMLADLRQRALSGANESLDYDLDYDQRQRWSLRYNRGTGRRCWGYSGATLGQWMLTIAVGVVVGALAYVLGALIQELQLAKLGLIERLLNPCAQREGECEGLAPSERAARLQPL